MTVCIAAICLNDNNEEHIVCVSDLKLSKGHYSINLGAIKFHRVHPKWVAMVAGLYAQKEPIVMSVRDALRSQENPMLQEVESAFTSAYQKFGRQLAEESVLSPYGLTIQDFLARRADLGDVIYQRLWDDIGKTKVGCDFLVSGFDGYGAHIFSVSSPSIENPSFVSDADEPGFAAIGSGSYIAESVLYSLEQQPIHKLHATIYNVCAAKFASETATDVGPLTYLKIVNREGQLMKITHQMEADIKDIWESNKPLIPKDALDLIKKYLNGQESKT